MLPFYILEAKSIYHSHHMTDFIFWQLSFHFWGKELPRFLFLFLWIKKTIAEFIEWGHSTCPRPMNSLVVNLIYFIVTSPNSLLYDQRIRNYQPLHVNYQNRIFLLPIYEMVPDDQKNVINSPLLNKINDYNSISLPLFLTYLKTICR